MAQAMLVKNVFMAIPPRKFLDLSGRTRDRIIEFLAQRGEELPDQVLGHAGQDALADTGDETADFADALKLQATMTLGPSGMISKVRAAIAVTERARARHLDAAGFRRRPCRKAKSRLQTNRRPQPHAAAFRPCNCPVRFRSSSCSQECSVSEPADRSVPTKAAPRLPGWFHSPPMSSFMTVAPSEFEQRSARDRR